MFRAFAVVWDTSLSVIAPGTFSVYSFCTLFSVWNVPEHTEVHVEKEKDKLSCLAERKGSRIWLTNELRRLPEALNKMKCYH